MSEAEILAKLAKQRIITPPYIFWFELLMLLMFSALVFSIFLFVKQFVREPVHFGMVNRDALIQEKAQEIAKETLKRSLLKGSLLKADAIEGTPSEEELTAKLMAYKRVYDKALEHFTKKRGIVLLNKSAFASSSPPDYTEEVRTLINKLSSLEDGSQRVS